jgi:hypothetical protein
MRHKSTAYKRPPLQVRHELLFDILLAAVSASGSTSNILLYTHQRQATVSKRPPGTKILTYSNTSIPFIPID